MSKFLTCEYCGTVYDPEKGVCPICGGSNTKPEAPDVPDFSLDVEEKAEMEHDPLSDFSFSFSSKDASSGKNPELEETRKFQFPDLDDPDEDEDEDFDSFTFSSSSHTSESPAKEVPPTVKETSPDEKFASEQKTVQKSVPEQKTAPAQKSAPELKTAPAQKNAPEQKAKPAQKSAPDVEAAPVKKAPPVLPEEADEPDDDYVPPKKKFKKKGTVTTKDKVVCLILATLVILAGLYIFYRFVRPYLGIASATEPTETQAPTQADLRCTAVLVDKLLTLKEVGQTHQLKVTLTPENTTDPLQFSSDNPKVATVSKDGLVTVTGVGTANITVSCGNVIAVCTVKCKSAPTAPTVPATTDATQATETEPIVDGPEELEMDRTDITFFKKGDVTRLSVGEWTAKAEWYSDDDSIATVDVGKVTARGKGTTTIYAKYGDAIASCIVRCNFEDSDDQQPDKKPDEGGSATISKTDVSIDVDESFTLLLKDDSGNTLDVNWSVGNAQVCSVSGNTVKGLSAGYTTVSCTYGGTTYSCIVRVR